MTLEITWPVADQLVSPFTCCGLLFSVQQEVRVGFLSAFSEAVKYNHHPHKTGLFQGLAGRFWVSLHANRSKSSMLVLQFAWAIECSLFWKVFL